MSTLGMSDTSGVFGCALPLLDVGSSRRPTSSVPSAAAAAAAVPVAPSAAAAAPSPPPPRPATTRRAGTGASRRTWRRGRGRREGWRRRRRRRHVGEHAIRARATQPEPTAVVYAARSLLTRGKSFSSPGHVRLNTAYWELPRDTDDEIAGTVERLQNLVLYDIPENYTIRAYLRRHKRGVHESYGHSDVMFHVATGNPDTCRLLKAQALNDFRSDATPWHHIAITSSTTHLYLDGEILEESSEIFGGVCSEGNGRVFSLRNKYGDELPLAPSTPLDVLWVRSPPTQNTPAHTHSHSVLPVASQVAIYKTALPANNSNLPYDWNSPPDPADSDLWGYWHAGASNSNQATGCSGVCGGEANASHFSSMVIASPSQWTTSPALAVEMAHLVDGFRHESVSQRHFLIQNIPLDEVSMGIAQGGGNTTGSGEGSATAFWAGVCASSCIETHGDVVHVVTVDRLVVPTDCQCYSFHSEATTLEAEPGSGDSQSHVLSHVAPSDEQIMSWLEGSTRLPYAERHDTYARISTYAVSRAHWNETYVATEQATVFHATLYERCVYPGTDDSQRNVFSIPLAGEFTGSTSLDDCIRSCSSIDSANPVKTVHWYNSASLRPKKCECFEVDLLAPRWSSVWRNMEIELPHFCDYHTWVSVRFCAGVVGGSERSLVYSREHDRFCQGVPVESGYELARHSLLSVSASDAVAGPEPFDLQCRRRCLDTPECGLAHVFVPTFDMHDMANRPTRRPAEPAERPAPQHPPLLPFPPAPPPEGGAGGACGTPARSTPPPSTRACRSSC